MKRSFEPATGLVVQEKVNQGGEIAVQNGSSVALVAGDVHTLAAKRVKDEPQEEKQDPNQNQQQPSNNNNNHSTDTKMIVVQDQIDSVDQSQGQFSQGKNSTNHDAIMTTTDNNNKTSIDNNNGSSGDNQTESSTANGNAVIHVTIDNLLYLVTLDALHQVFTKVGKVEKIVTFLKNGKFQALVQFSTIQAAQAAKQTFDRQNIYPSACSMKIEYSKMPTLNVRFNNDKTRDFTNPSLPSGPQAQIVSQPDSHATPVNSTLNNVLNVNMPSVLNSNGSLCNSHALASGHSHNNNKVTNHHHNHNDNMTFSSSPAAVAAAAASAASLAVPPHSLRSGTGRAHNDILTHSKNGQATASILDQPLASSQTHVTNTHVATAAALAAAYHAHTQFGGQGQGHGLVPHPHAYPHHTQPQHFNNLNLNNLNIGGHSMNGPVLLAFNLDEQVATPDALFTLFGVFGDVMRVKVLFNKKDNALIQMADAAQADCARIHLDRKKVFSRAIRVMPSKHSEVQLPREPNSNDAGMTRDFTNSQLHRFKIPGSRNFHNIYPPSSTLHLSNIPSSVTEQQLEQAFEHKCGFRFSQFKFFPKDRKMALACFQSTEQAIIALIKMHNFNISDDSRLRVSFSKMPIHSQSSHS